MVLFSGGEIKTDEEKSEKIIKSSKIPIRVITEEMLNKWARDPEIGPIPVFRYPKGQEIVSDYWGYAIELPDDIGIFITKEKLQELKEISIKFPKKALWEFAVHIINLGEQEFLNKYFSAMPGEERQKNSKERERLTQEKEKQWSVTRQGKLEDFYKQKFLLCYQRALIFQLIAQELMPSVFPHIEMGDCAVINKGQKENTSGYGHAWNIVEVKGETILIDTSRLSLIRESEKCFLPIYSVIGGGKKQEGAEKDEDIVNFQSEEGRRRLPHPDLIVKIMNGLNLEYNDREVAPFMEP